jgi:hypothetical protein
MTPVEAISEIRRGLDLLYRAGDVVELRAFHKTFLKHPTTVSGYFNDLDKLALAIHEVNTHKYKNGKQTHVSVFTTLNPVRVSWQCVDNRAYWGSKQLQKEIIRTGVPLADSTRLRSDIKFESKETYYSMRTTSDGESDILTRRWILLDVDAGQPSGTNSTNTEKATAFEMLGAITGFLSERGFPAMALCDSGNGWHGLIRVDLPNISETTDTVRRFLKALAKQFDNQYGKAHLDTTVYNAGRITKAYGSFVFKGAHTLNRPCRRSRVVSAVYALCPSELISNLADGFEPPSVLRTFAAQIDDVEQQKQVMKLIEYLDHNDVEHHEMIVSDGWVKIPITCPNEAEHTTEGIETSTFVSVSQGGAFGFKCHHEHCAHLSGWKNFRPWLDKEFRRLHPGEPAFQFDPQPQAFFTPLPPEPEEPEVQQNIVVNKVLKPIDIAIALLNELCQPMHPVKEVNKLATERGLKSTTLRRASKMLGLITSHADRSGDMLVKAPTRAVANKLVMARRKAG